MPRARGQEAMPEPHDEIAELDQTIRELTAILDVGMTETTVQGEKVKFDLDVIAGRLRRAKRRKAVLENASVAPPCPHTTIDLSGSY